ncbi:hypothetical protein [Roseovarius pelagicus]|uniref:Gluconate 2-dehydrogenase subunit 3 n=1 Tax=Roseovarius pelagicus TaxID=2980108 RepID=A0ABY6D740_9RHOB|nr:hypothetical protein [Roseovarius pelagicus]UXX81435.1 hypothetical protein N7U68_00820 [Roseovarius pelagicus]
MTENANTSFFDAKQRATLRLVAGVIIPPCSARGLPGADDPAIFDDILASAGRDKAELARALDLLGAAGESASLQETQPGSLLATFRAEHPALAEVLSLVIAQCYYRDARVLEAIGMEPRPPYPKGFTALQGDWSLLDPVRARGPIYRAVPTKDDSG